MKYIKVSEKEMDRQQKKEKGMTRRVKAVGMMAVAVCLASACGRQAVQPDEPAAVTPVQNDQAQETDEKNPELTLEPTPTVDPQNRHVKGIQTALVTDVSETADHGFNQAALDGIQTYAAAACVSFTAYSADENTPDAYKNTVLAAVRDGADLIICAGEHFEEAVGGMQNEYEDVFFLLLDGVPRDASGDEVDIAPNVHCITYREEEAGYLAGYMAVLDGYHKFGFIGGEELPTVLRYGYGYLQGIDDAAVSLEIEDEIQVDYWYADTFLPDKEIEEVSGEWYEDGTEIIFVCGGSIYESVLVSAEECEGKLIGADVDQSDVSERFVTSAMKGVDSSIIVALDDFFASGRKWPKEMAGEVVSYGAKERCSSLPVQDHAWRFQTATTDRYLQLLARLKSGAVQLPVDTDDRPETTVTVIYHNQQEESDS